MVLCSAVFELAIYRAGDEEQGAGTYRVAPTKIIGIGRNYRAHAAEMGGDIPPEPLMFLKPPSALLEPGGLIR